jgi:hypothetical protein
MFYMEVHMTALADRLKSTDLAFLVARTAHELTMKKRGYRAKFEFAPVLACRLESELFEPSSGKRRELAPSVEGAYQNAIKQISRSNPAVPRDLELAIRDVVDQLNSLDKAPPGEVSPVKIEDLLIFMESLYSQLISENRRDQASRVRARFGS